MILRLVYGLWVPYSRLCAWLHFECFPPLGQLHFVLVMVQWCSIMTSINIRSVKILAQLCRFTLRVLVWVVMWCKRCIKHQLCIILEDLMGSPGPNADMTGLGVLLLRQSEAARIGCSEVAGELARGEQSKPPHSALDREPQLCIHSWKKKLGFVS